MSENPLQQIHLKFIQASFQNCISTLIGLEPPLSEKQAVKDIQIYDTCAYKDSADACKSLLVSITYNVNFSHDDINCSCYA